jgi:hypothetical protein
MKFVGGQPLRTGERGRFLVAHATGYAQIFSPTISTTGATCSDGSADGDCRNTVGFSTPDNGAFTSRYARNINGESGGATYDTSGTASHHVDFTVTRIG